MRTKTSACVCCRGCRADGVNTINNLYGVESVLAAANRIRRRARRRTNHGVRRLRAPD